MKQKKDLNKMELAPLTQDELTKVSGGVGPIAAVAIVGGGGLIALAGAYQTGHNIGTLAYNTFTNCYYGGASFGQGFGAALGSGFLGGWHVNRPMLN
jgi:lactobin A/cerein 7B family class IIb bacteriocin